MPDDAFQPNQNTMTKQLAITFHTKAVQARNYLRAHPINTETDPVLLLEMERKISVYGQAHNPRISAKSLAALILN